MTGSIEFHNRCKAYIDSFPILERELRKPRSDKPTEQMQSLQQQAMARASNHKQSEGISNKVQCLSQCQLPDSLSSPGGIQQYLATHYPIVSKKELPKSIPITPEMNDLMQALTPDECDFIHRACYPIDVWSFSLRFLDAWFFKINRLINRLISQTSDPAQKQILTQLCENSNELRDYCLLRIGFSADPRGEEAASQYGEKVSFQLEIIKATLRQVQAKTDDTARTIKDLNCMMVITKKWENSPSRKFYNFCIKELYSFKPTIEKHDFINWLLLELIGYSKYVDKMIGRHFSDYHDVLITKHLQRLYDLLTTSYDNDSKQRIIKSIMSEWKKWSKNQTTGKFLEHQILRSWSHMMHADILHIFEELVSPLTDDHFSVRNACFQRLFVYSTEFLDTWGNGVQAKIAKNRGEAISTKRKIYKPLNNILTSLLSRVGGIPGYHKMYTHDLNLDPNHELYQKTYLSMLQLPRYYPSIFNDLSQDLASLIELRELITHSENDPKEYMPAIIPLCYLVNVFYIIQQINSEDPNYAQIEENNGFHPELLRFLQDLFSSTTAQEEPLPQEIPLEMQMAEAVMEGTTAEVLPGSKTEILPPSLSGMTLSQSPEKSPEVATTPAALTVEVDLGVLPSAPDSTSTTTSIRDDGRVLMQSSKKKREKPSTDPVAALSDVQSEAKEPQQIKSKKAAESQFSKADWKKTMIAADVFKLLATYGFKITPPPGKSGHFKASIDGAGSLPIPAHGGKPLQDRTLHRIQREAEEIMHVRSTQKT